jgi:hypothetical protein
MERCEVCGEPLKIYREVHEAWGRPVVEEWGECVNSNCGEEDEE